MSDLWQETCQRLGDVLLGWLLALPRNAALVLLAVLSVLLAIGLRRLVTDQSLLRRIRQDQRQLKQLIRAARANRDESARARYRRTAGAVAMLRIRQELRVLLVSLLPLAMLMSWAAQRIHYLPPAPHEPVELVAWFPSSAVGAVTHLVPLEGLRSQGGWVREIEPSRCAQGPRAAATWVVQAAGDDSPYPLTIRFREQTFEHPLLIGRRVYAAVRRSHGDDFETVLRLREYRPLGLGTAGWLPPWLWSYLVVALLAYPLLKRMLRVA